MTATLARPTFKVLGIDRDHDQCECCGRKGLKLTVVLGRLDADRNVIETIRFGRDCAARATQLRRTGAAMEALASEAQAAADRAELNRVHEVGEHRSVINWVIESVGSNGGSLTPLGRANGTRPLVQAWAEQRWPNQIIQVRNPNGPR